MKTLDEVIKAYEQCAKSDLEEGCGDCAYKKVKHGACKCVRNDDALHYLRELKLFRQTSIMQGIHKMQKDYALYPVSDWGEDEPDFNPALTWDELRQMEGKPIWVEWTKSEESYWCFVGEWFDDDEMRIYRKGWDYADYIHKTIYTPDIVRAYRKERTE